MSLFHTKPFWEIVLGKEWAADIFPLVIEKNPTFCNSLRALNKLYDDGVELYPKSKSDIFRAFRECPREKFKVLFIGEDPYPNNNATGIAFGNSANTSSKEYSPAFSALQDALERNYPGFGRFLDPTLSYWARQGVLLLNSSLTVCPNNKYDFTSTWRIFISEVVKLITGDGNRVVVLLGNVARSFESDVEFFNCLIKTTHPAHNYRYNTDLKLDFKQINSYLKLHWGEEIEWAKMPF